MVYAKQDKGGEKTACFSRLLTGSNERKKEKKRSVEQNIGRKDKECPHIEPSPRNLPPEEGES